MWKVLSEIILKNRILIILIIMSITVFMFQKGQEARLSYMMPKLLPDNHEARIDYDNFLNKYGTQNIFIIAIEDSQLTNYDHINALSNITHDINNVKGVEKVISITNLPILLKDTIAEQFIARKWLSSKIKNQEEMDKEIRRFLTQPFYKNQLTNTNNTVTALLISLNDEIIKSANREELIFTIKNLIDDYSTEYNLVPHFSGLPYLRTVDSIMVRSEILMFVL